MAKAWLVEPYDGYWGDGEGCPTEISPIVCAETEEEAVEKSGWVGEYDRSEIVASRAPAFDDKPLTPQTYLENGWWLQCGGCSERLTIDGPDGWEDSHESAPGVVYDRGGWPHCGQACLDRARDERRKYQAARDAEREAVPNA